jgi:hypothetical protein
MVRHEGPDHDLMPLLSDRSNARTSFIAFHKIEPPSVTFQDFIKNSVEATTDNNIIGVTKFNESIISCCVY